MYHYDQHSTSSCRHICIVASKPWADDRAPNASISNALPFGRSFSFNILYLDDHALGSGFFGFWVLSSGKVNSRKCKDIKTCSTDDVLFDPLDVCLQLPARVLWYVDLLVDVHSKILGS